MSSNQHEIKYMIGSLKVMHEKLGGGNTKRALAGSQFDFIQEEFLAKRHQVEKWQDIKQKEGITTKTADVAYKIREGVTQLRDLLGKLQSEYDRLDKKKKDTPAVLANKKKIVANCQQLYKDIEDRYNGTGEAPVGKKYMTLTDMKAKLLTEIDTANANIQHQYNSGSQDMLDELDEEQLQAMQAYKKKDEQMDVCLDQIIMGMQEVRKGVQNINEKQDQINTKVVQQNKQAQKMNKRIQRDNDKLKVIIEKFNSTKCCLVVFLMLLIIGLVVVIIKFLTPSQSSDSK